MYAVIFLFYLAAGLAFWLFERGTSRMAEERRPALARLTRLGVGLLSTGAVIHLAHIGAEARRGHIPFLDLESSLSGLTICWVAIGIIFITTMRIPLLGLIISPLAAISSLALNFIPVLGVEAHPRMGENVPGAAVVIHAVAGFAGYAAFFTAAFGGALYLLQDRQLRRKNLGLLFEHLPPLERSVRVMTAGVLAGLGLFACTILIAVVFLFKTVPITEISRDANIRTVVALWCYAFVILVTALRCGWNKPRIAGMTLLLGILIMVFRVLFAFGGGLHSFSAG